MAAEPHNFFIDKSPLLFVAKNNALNVFLQVKSQKKTGFLLMNMEKIFHDDIL
jgi:hypothetical protein